mmetsp:Transcript_98871/g.285356  ORF Transcript_98871/g.285356 Transcript_98871/m.285356 type:complete len:509 (-) Transcript_98871:351-1877(-)
MVEKNNEFGTRQPEYDVYSGSSCAACTIALEHHAYTGSTVETALPQTWHGWLVSSKRSMQPQHAVWPQDMATRIATHLWQMPHSLECCGSAAVGCCSAVVGGSPTPSAGMSASCSRNSPTRVVSARASANSRVAPRALPRPPPLPPAPAPRPVQRLMAQQISTKAINEDTAWPTLISSTPPAPESHRPVRLSQRNTGSSSPASSPASKHASIVGPVPSTTSQAAPRNLPAPNRRCLKSSGLLWLPCLRTCAMEPPMPSMRTMTVTPSRVSMTTSPTSVSALPAARIRKPPMDAGGIGNSMDETALPPGAIHRTLRPRGEVCNHTGTAPPTEPSHANAAESSRLPLRSVSGAKSERLASPAGANSSPRCLSKGPVAQSLAAPGRSQEAPELFSHIPHKDCWHHTTWGCNWKPRHSALNWRSAFSNLPSKPIRPPKTPHPSPSSLQLVQYTTETWPLAGPPGEMWGPRRTWPPEALLTITGAVTLALGPPCPGSETTLAQTLPREVQTTA